MTQLVTGTNSVSLTNNNWYTGRVVVGDDLGNSALQRLRFWVDTDGDGDFADETTLLDTTTIDDVWSAGHVGLFRGSVSNAQDFDDFKAGIDANADLDIADAGDEVVVDDDFATNVITRAYDNNGNLSDDGVNKHVYDGWNRHVKSTWRIKSPPSAVVAYEHDGSNRRVSKAVTNSGVENSANDGGNTTQEYLFANGRLVEERNGSNQLTRAYMWHDGQLVWFEANGDPTIGNDSNPDLTATGEGSEATLDQRYPLSFAPSGAFATLTVYAVGGGGQNGAVAERHLLAGHGLAAQVQSGGSVGAEVGRSMQSSSLGFSVLQSYVRASCNRRESSFGRQRRPVEVDATSELPGSVDGPLVSGEPEQCCGCTCAECETRGSWHTGFLCDCGDGYLTIVARCLAPQSAFVASGGGGRTAKFTVAEDISEEMSTQHENEDCCGCSCFECETRGSWHTGFLCDCGDGRLTLIARCTR